MEFKKKKIFEYQKENYIILSILEENNEQYAFTNKINTLDQEPTDEYCIFIKKEKMPEIIIDKDLIYRLMPKFQEQIKKDMESLLDMGE